MMNKSAIIPLYLNSIMVDNLFTILVEELSLSLKNDLREQVVVNIDTPLRELIKGQYVQGDFKLQLLNEYSRENYAQIRVKRIDIFVQLMRILRQQSMIKKIDHDDINPTQINAGDYIEVHCELMEDHLIRWFQEIESVVNSMSYLNKSKASQLNDVDLVQKAHDELRKYNESKNTRLITEKFKHNNIRFTFIIEDEFIEGAFGNMLEGPVTIIGKVIKKLEPSQESEVVDKDNNNNNKSRRVCTYCDKFINYMEMDKLENKINDINKITDNIRIPDNFLEDNNEDCIYKIIPLAIYF